MSDVRVKKTLDNLVSVYTVQNVRRRVTVRFFTYWEHWDKRELYKLSMCPPSNCDTQDTACKSSNFYSSRF